MTDGRDCENMIPMGITLPVDRSGYLLYDSDCGICLAMAGFLAKRVTRVALACSP